MSFQDIRAEVGADKILAVSKLQPIDKIRGLYNQGQRKFGENYVQEALDKKDQLKDLTDIEWHLIGHLQKNKAKYVVGQFALIHSVDSLELAQTLNRQCESKKVTQRILIQVNLAGEDSKSGFDKSALMACWNELIELPHLTIDGFMTMPPLSETGEDVRPYFKELRELQQHLAKTTDSARHPLKMLSMGTSSDYKVAIQEGATLVRLGTVLFGARN
ncbi:YggS family pyridoxal phosphate-dependent enzyme [Bdellovibrio sp. SKB1291214]|uniref:YggS family pyridoxal phosphate-dependent enzyme n=1 Tax=Bdellovibrio sp. SKB1291214 TaxID=1732569 RepID=UPI00223F7A60|nr:YggS family pyridoxal phosphate-dependent enzyme [Bdellovibrio sp. SKB1291214]UYL10167.1 YggS family pyridoxal phosphate-dependent enzyme [Bdellovibrio sp. SKB1291214]